MFFADYADKVLYRKLCPPLSDIRATRRQLDEIICLDDFLNRLDVDIATFTFGVLTYKSMILTLWVRDRMGLNSSKPLSLAPIEISELKDFFASFSSRMEPSATPRQRIWDYGQPGIRRT